MGNQDDRSAAQVLQDFSTSVPWVGLPGYGYEEFKRLASELRKQYDCTVSLRQSAYPELPVDVHPLQLPPGEWPKGVCYTIELSKGITLSVTLDLSGTVIERHYSDRGNIHTDDMIKMLRGWQKTIKQVQRGGRPKGMSKATQARYDRIWTAWQSDRSLSEKEFCRSAKITRRTLDRVIDYQRKKK